MTITTRAGKGSALTHAELDANFTTIGAAHGDTAPILKSGGISCAAQSEHIIFTELNSAYYSSWEAAPIYFYWSGGTYGRRGNIMGTGLMPDGRSTICRVEGFNNPGGTGMRIFLFGGSGIGNSGWTSVSWSNPDGSITGSCTRANAGYTTQTPSNTNTFDRYYTISNLQTFTGTNPRYVMDDKFIKLTFTV